MFWQAILEVQRMSWSCSVRVVDDDGDGREGVKVTLMGSGLLGGHLTEYTDSDGWAEFEMDSDRDEWIVENIYVDGDEVCGSMSIDDGDTMSFTI